MTGFSSLSQVLPSNMFDFQLSPLLQIRVLRTDFQYRISEDLYFIGNGDVDASRTLGELQSYKPHGHLFRSEEVEREIHTYIG